MSSKRRADRQQTRSEVIDEFDLTNSVGLLMRRSRQHLWDLISPKLVEAGIRPRQFVIMHTVYRNPGMNQTELVRLTGIDRSTAAEVIARLVRRGFLSRSRTDTDQRANALHITGDGVDVLRAVIPEVSRSQAQFLEPLSSEERETFFHCLRILSGLPDTMVVSNEDRPGGKRGEATPTRRDGNEPG